MINIEEKARRYDEAIEKAKAWCDCEHATTDDKILLSRIFSELKESEDEKIRKALIKYFTLSDYNADYQCCGVHCKDIVTWLEKQGTPAKYHDLCDSCVRQPTCQSDCFLQQSEQKHNPVLNIEIPFGAKDSELQEAFYYIPEGFHAEIDGNRVVIKRGEQKPTEWSEEDECFFNTIDALISNEYSLDDDEKENLSNWLKSLRPQSQWKPSEEQINALDNARHSNPFDVHILDTLFHDLKKLREE